MVEGAFSGDASGSVKRPPSLQEQMTPEQKRTEAAGAERRKILEANPHDPDAYTKSLKARVDALKEKLAKIGGSTSPAESPSVPSTDSIRKEE